MKKITLFFVFVLSFLQFPAFSQFLGGEITWEVYQPYQSPSAAGKFKIILKVYQDCYTSSGPTTPYDSIQYLRTTVPGFDTIKLFLSAGYPTDVSPVCNSNQSNQIMCGGTTYQVNSGARKEYVFTSEHFFPNGVQLAGVPPAIGWTFYWNGGMRNPADNLIGNHSVRLKSIMYPYNNQNVYPGFDHSPMTQQFSNDVICAGNFNTYNLFASDKDLDSLAYSFYTLTDSSNAIISNYNSGYSYLSPLPGSIQNPLNIPSTLNASNGDLSFQCFTPGTYALCIKISAYKHIDLVSEVYKNIYFTILNCPNNNPPQANFSHENIEYVIAGQHYTKLIKFTDADTFSDGTSQTLKLQSGGKQLGFNSSGGCFNPPCAQLLPSTPISGLGIIETVLDWQTSCSHLSMLNTCNHFSDLFEFKFIASDDFCPTPATKLTSIMLKVIPSPLCIHTMYNGNVHLIFRDFKFDGLVHNFKYYKKFQTDTLYTLIDSSYSNAFQFHFEDSTLLGNDSIFDYKVERDGWDISLKQKSQVLKLNSTFLPNLNAYKIMFNMPIQDCDLKKFSIEKKIGSGNWQKIISPVTAYSSDTIFDLTQKVEYAFSWDVILGPDTISSPNICQSTSSIDSFVPPGLGMEEHTIHNCQIFPNPTQNFFFLKYQSNKLQSCEISVFDANGKFLERRKFQFVAGENQIKMDLNFQYKGLFMIEILTEDDVVWKKLVRK